MSDDKKKPSLKRKRDLDPLELRNIFEVKGGKIFWINDRKCKFIGDEASGYCNKRKKYFVKYNSRVYSRSEIIYAITTGNWPPERLKHLNFDRTDDRFENLVLISQFKEKRKEFLSKKSKPVKEPYFPTIEEAENFEQNFTNF